MTKTRTRLLGIVLAAVLLLTWMVPALAQETERGLPAEGDTIDSQPVVSVVGTSTISQLPAITSEQVPQPDQTPDNRYNIWYGDTVRITMPQQNGYTTYWGVNDAVSPSADNTASPAEIQGLKRAQYLTVRLVPENPAAKILYGVYVLVPFSFTGVAITPAGLPEGAEPDLGRLPYGTRLRLRAEVQLTDSFNEPLAAPENTDSIYGRTPVYSWATAPDEYAAVLDQAEASAASVTVDTTSPAILGISKVVEYQCRVSGLPNPGNEEHLSSQSVAVLAPEMRFPAGTSDVIQAEIGGEPTELTLSWGGTVASDADLSGLELNGRSGGANHTALTPELGAEIEPGGVIITVPQINATQSYKPGAEYTYILQLCADGQNIGDSLQLTVRLVPKSAKVASVAASTNAVAAGQSTQLSAVLKDVERETGYQWEQSAPGETPAWIPLSGEGASGIVGPGESIAPLVVYPDSDTLYNLRLTAADGTAARAMTPASVYVFRLAAKDDNSTPGAVTGLPALLSVEWQPTSTQRDPDAPTAPDRAPAVTWTPAADVVVSPAGSMQASVTLPQSLQTPLRVDAAYAVDAGAPSGLAAPVAFSVTPVVLQTSNGTASYTFPERVPTGNPVTLPVEWSAAAVNAQNVRLNWSVSEAPAGSKAQPPVTTVSGEGVLGATTFTPDLEGTYKLSGAAYGGPDSSSDSPVGGAGVEITLVAEVVQVGQARIIPLDGTTVAVGNPLRFQAQIANASGVYQAPTASSAGTWQVQTPGGQPETVRGSDNGVASFTPHTAGTYTITYTPAAPDGIAASMTFTATDPQAPAVAPTISLTVRQGEQPAGKSIAAGTNLTAEITVQNLPASVATVTGSLSVFGFGEAPVNKYTIATADGSGSQQLTFQVPRSAEDGTPLRIGIRTAVAGVTGVSISLPAEEWTATVATSQLEIELTGPSTATVNQPYSMMLTANKTLVADEIFWTLSGTDADYAASNGTPVLTFTPSQTGTVNVSVSVRSQSGQTATAAAHVDVRSELAVTLSGPAAAEVGKAVTITAVPSTSAQQIQLTWELDPGYSYAVAGQSIIFTPDETGTVSVRVSAALGSLHAADATTVDITNAAPDGSASPSPGPSSSASASPSPDDSASPSGEPSSSASPSGSPSGSAEPSASPSGSPSAGPSASVSPVPGGSAPTAENTLLRLKQSSNLRMTVRSFDYYIEGIKIVTKESQRISAAELRDEFETPSSGYIRIANMRGETDKDTDPVGTGVSVQLMAPDGHVREEAIVLVMGDVLGSGLLNIAQLVRMARDLNGTQVLLGVYRMAGDLNGSGSVDIGDLVREAQMLNSSRRV